MQSILRTAWGISIVAALLGAIIVAVIGVVIMTPPVVTIFAAANFAACLIVLIQFAIILSTILSTRGTAQDVGATLAHEAETAEGVQVLKRMSFSSLLTVATAQELHSTLTVHDRPWWVWNLLGVFGEEAGLVAVEETALGDTPGERLQVRRNYGAYNRYLEWMLLLGALVFALLSGMLLSVYGYQIGQVSGTANPGFTGALCAFSSCFVGLLFALGLGLFSAGIIRRASLLYTLRAEGVESP